jgi:hypothetical protein
VSDPLSDRRSSAVAYVDVASNWRDHPPHRQAAFRRADLITWIEERPAHDGLTASEIVDVSGIYDRIQGRYDKAMADLKVMEDSGHLARSDGRPARWFATRDRDS